MRASLVVLPILILLALPRTTPAAPEAHPLRGFRAEGAAKERELETAFDTSLRKENLPDWMKRLSAKPHHVGSPAGKENAEWIRDQLRSWGYDARIEEFQVLFPTPKSRLLEMTAPATFTARLMEPPIPEDATSAVTQNQLPPYNAYSIDGDVTGDVVYANYGVPDDYETLARRGIDVKGKIVLTRYGGSWRGIKPKVAAEHGAIGCLIYSDPKDDGYFQGDVYPKGAYRNENGAQRGSVADMPVFPGDPLTPGVGATAEARRLPIKDAPTLTKIPVLPIAFGDALPILRALGGPVAPEEWRGALPITYHLGPGSARVHLKLEFNWDLVPCRDVIATLRGGELPDEWVIRGNHHDAWIFGADDPLSGTVAVMEEARAVGELAKTGWKPKRTIVYCLWDGEEPGLIGSTEWVETHADLLTKNAAVYVNSDSNGRGFLRAGGSHSLERLVGEVADDVNDPEKRIPVGERQRAFRLVRGTPEDKRTARDDPQVRLGALGSGSDYTPFLQHLGVASLDIRFTGEDGGGSYHSIYDSFDHYTRFGDPGFDYGVALVQTAGRIVLRCADADILPFQFGRLASTVDGYAKEVGKLADDMRAETAEQNRLLREGALVAAADPKETFVAPEPKAPVPYLNFAPLQNAVTHLQDAARAADQAVEARMSPGAAPLSKEQQQALDQALIATERTLLAKDGLPRRPWFRHLIYAPGFYTGYAVKTLPGPREAIEQRKWDEAAEQIPLAAAALEALAAQLARVTEASKPTN